MCKYLNELNENGYILFKNVINSNDSINNIIKNNNKVDYTKIKLYIENYILSSINKLLNWNSVYTKFRVSNNNNNDAGQFHRDIITQKYTNSIDPIYTCIYYLDTTIMELIPKSHKYKSLSFYDIIKLYNTKIKIKIEPTDILLFNSSLLHRGFLNKEKINRRVIQIFELCPSINEYNYYSSIMLQVEGDESKRDIMHYINRLPVINNIINYIRFLNASNGYGIVKSLNTTSIKYIIPEGFSSRLTIIPNTLQELNKYVIINRADLLPDKYLNEFKYSSFYYQYISYSIILCIYIYIIYILLKSIIK